MAVGLRGRHHGRQPRGQGAALRHRQQRAVGGRHHRAPRTARSTPPTTPTPASAARVPLVNMMTGEVIFGGVGLGPLRDAAVGPAGGVHRRADGGPHARVPRQEDRGARGEARADRDVLACRSACWSATGARDRHQVRRALDLQPGPAGLLGDPLRLHLAGATTTAPRSPATPASCSRTRPATWAPSASPSPTCSAAWRCSSAASCRCSPRWRSPARWPPSGSRPPAPGTFRTDTPTFVFLLISVIVIVAALTFFPALLLGPIVQGLTDQLF